MSRITYEITANVSAEIRADYERFMIAGHIPELMATGRLDKYLNEDAPRRRANLLESFRAGVEAALSQPPSLTVAFPPGHVRQ